MSGTWLYRGLRELVFLLAGLVALLLLAAAGLWWWSGSEGSLAWALDQLSRLQPLSAQGVQGSLREGLRAEQLHWRRPDGLDVKASGVRLEWQPLALLRWRQLRLDQVQAQQVQVQDRRPPSPSHPPDRLELPLHVQADQLKIGHIEWIQGDRTLAVDNVAGAYSYDGARHRVQLESLRWTGGDYQGEATLGARGNMPLDARLQGRFEAPMPAGAARLPLQFSAQLQGPLADLQAQATLVTVPRPGPARASVSATASVTARITPWAAQPIAQAQAQWRQLDLAALWPQRLPHTLLTGQASVQPSTTGTWTVSADVSNASAGPWDRARLPVNQMSVQGEWRTGGQALVRRLQARLGGGQLQAHGRWEGVSGWTVQGELRNVDPSALYGAMAALPLNGRADARSEGGAIAFNVNLKAAGGKAAQVPGRGGNPLAAAVRALELRQAFARGRWDKGHLALPEFDVRTADATARGVLELWPATRAGSGRVNLDAPGLQARIEGQLAETSGSGRATVQLADAARAVRWMQRLPLVAAPLQGLDLAGRGEAQIAWQGGWRDPALQGRVTAPLLELRGLGPPAPSNADAGAPWLVRDAVASLDGRLSDAVLQVHGRAEQGQRRLALDLSGRGGRRSRSPEVWQGRVVSLGLAASDPALGRGSWKIALQRPFDLRAAAGSFDAGAGEALLVAPAQAAQAGPPAPAVLTWEPVRWRTGELDTSGRLTGLPLAWLAIAGGPQLAGSAISGDMVFDAQWDASLGATPRLRASIARSRGDLTLQAETAQGTPASVRAGVREARLALTSEGEAVTLALKWDSERGGSAQGRLATRLARGGAAGWSWPEDAPLEGSVRAQLPRIGVWSLLAPPGWRLRGSLGANVIVAGTRSQPRLAGTLAADDLALRSVVDGVELQGGRLRARLDGQRLLIDEFVLHGAGDPAAGGTLLATGEGAWSGGAARARVTAQLSRLRASIRSDRQLTVSGNVVAGIDRAGSEVMGNLQVDQARIVLPDQTAPRLGDDVVVRGADGPVTAKQARATEQAGAQGARRVNLAIDLDLGSDFRVQGRGIDTRLRGKLALSGQSLGEPRLNGTIRAGGGQYEAYGQKLDIERGLLRFTGPIDNPSLDILAIRPRLTQRVGVQVTGTVLAPYVRLYAEPDMADVDKLSWLVLGRASAAGGAEAALLQQAAVALVAGRSGGGKRGVVASLGLDELSFRREGPNGPAVTLGKQLGRNIYAAYERSLSGAMGTLQVFYDLTRQLKLRAEAGERSAVDLIYTFSFN